MSNQLTGYQLPICLWSKNGPSPSEKLFTDIINDISGGELDEKMFETIGELNMPYILMHMKGNPQNMQSLNQYQDVIDDGLDNLECVEAPSEFMVFIRRIFSPVAVAFISLCDGVSEKWSNLKESIAGKNLCCHCYNHRYHPSLNKHK